MVPVSHTNWMGYEIHVGDIVFYSTGGSYPHFRVGQVLEFKESKHSYSSGNRSPEIHAKVHWLFERGFQWDDNTRNWYVPFALDKTSTVSAEVLCPVSDNLTDMIGNHKFGLDNPRKSVV
jgi:hypothetical protein